MSIVQGNSDRTLWILGDHLVYRLYLGVCYIRRCVGNRLGSRYCHGDVPTAMKCAAVIKPMFLAFTGARRYRCCADEAAATLGGVSVTLIGVDVSHIRHHRCSVEPLVCSVAYSSAVSYSSYPVQKADEYAKHLQHQRHHVHGCLVAADLQVLPLRHPDVLRPVLRRRGRLVASLNGLPVWITNALSATGKMLPRLWALP